MDTGEHWTRELFLTTFISDLVEQHSNQFHISQIKCPKDFFGRGPQGRNLEVQLCQKAVTTADCFMSSYFAMKNQRSVILA